MSRNPSSAAIMRDDAALGELSPHAVTVPRQDLADLAAMLVRVEALLTADATPEPNGSDSIERIADIAFVLHERDVEASLCDALDAAVQEISAAGARKEDRARRARQAAEVLRELSQRVGDMIALSQVQHSEPPGTARRIEVDLPPVMASRSGSLPSPIPAAALTSDPQYEVDVVTAPPSRPIQQSKPPGGQGAAALNAAGSTVQLRPSAAAAISSAEPITDAFLDDDLHEDLDEDLHEDLDEDLLLPTTASETAVSNKLALNEVSSSEAPSRAPNLVSPSSVSPRKETPLFLNPEDDPGDLFEPEADIPPPAPEPSMETPAPPPAPESGLRPVLSRGAAVAIDEAGSLAAELPVESSNPPRPLRFPAAAVPPSAPRLESRPESTDPLAPMRALSEEEIIALFS
jgi:hypothetical protein